MLVNFAFTVNERCNEPGFCFRAAASPTTQAAVATKTHTDTASARDTGAISHATGAATAGDYAALATFETHLQYGGSSSTLTVYDLRTGHLVNRLGGETVSWERYPCESTMDDVVINDQGFTGVHSVESVPCSAQSAAGECEEIQASDDTGPRTIDTAVSSSSTKPALTGLTLTKDTLT